MPTAGAWVIGIGCAKALDTGSPPSPETPSTPAACAPPTCDEGIAGYTLDGPAGCVTTHFPGSLTLSSDPAETTPTGPLIRRWTLVSLDGSIRFDGFAPDPFLFTETGPVPDLSWPGSATVPTDPYAALTADALILDFTTPPFRSDAESGSIVDGTLRTEGEATWTTTDGGTTGGTLDACFAVPLTLSDLP